MVKKIIVRDPYFSINTKSYLYGKKALDLAIEADKLAEKHDIDVFFTCQHVDIYPISNQTKRLIITAQSMNGIFPGPGMGKILPDAIVEAGAKAVNLNHAENPMDIFELTKAQKIAEKLGLFTFMCASSLEDCAALAMLNPDVIVCEKTELIGSGVISDVDYMRESYEIIKSINPDIMVTQAAGISTADDVLFVLNEGSQGTGASSSIMLSENPIQLIEEMLQAIVKFRNK